MVARILAVDVSLGIRWKTWDVGAQYRQ